MNYLKAAKHFSISFSDFILPRFCCACERKLSTDQNTICDRCFSKIRHTSAARLQNEFEKKFGHKKIISDFFAPFVFETDRELQRVLHSFKYDKKFRTGIFLGNILALKLKEQKPHWQFDIILPIPLHQLKKAERGYNQSLFIAKGTEKIFNVNFSDQIVKRVRYTESQTQLNAKEREENISDAFRVRKNNIVAGKNILLLDDVITTGATISECGKTLLEAGANKVYAASIAIAD